VVVTRKACPVDVNAQRLRDKYIRVRIALRKEAIRSRIAVEAIVFAHDARERYTMTASELAAFLTRARELFPRGAENQDVYAAFQHRLKEEDSERANAALEDYAVHHAGAGRWFIPGVFMQHLARQPDSREQRETTERIAKAREERSAYEAAVEADWQRMRRRVAAADPFVVAEVVDRLRDCGWRVDGGDPERWSRSVIVCIVEHLEGRELPTWARERGRLASTPRARAEAVSGGISAPTSQTGV
jgi:hypothetical protein